MDVSVLGSPGDVALLIECNAWQQRFRFREAPAAGIVQLSIAEAANRPFSVSRAGGVAISTREIDGICRYANIGRGFYLSVCSLLGLVQWRALAMNELLEYEDFLVHEDPPGCLYAARDTIQEYALAFEYPDVCDACLDFYRCLGTEPEIMALQEVLNTVMIRGPR